MMSMGMAMDPEAAKLQPMITAYIDAVESMSRQIDNFLLTASLSGEELRMHSEARPVEGSALGSYLAAMPSGKLETMKYLPADSILVCASKMGDWAPLTNWSRKLMDGMVSASGLDVGAFESLWQWTDKLAAVYGDEFSAALLQSDDGSMTIVEVINLKDAAAAEKLFAESQPMLDEFGELYKAMGMEMSLQYTPAAQTHNETEINEWAMDIGFGEMPGIPAEEAAEIAERQQKMMSAMFGGPEMTGYSAFLGNDMVIIFGKDSLAALKQVIDGDMGTAASSASLAAALEGMPEKRSGIFYMSLGDFANMYLAMMRPMLEEGEMGMPPELAELKFEKGPGIVATWNMSDGMVSKDVEVPAEEIRLLVQGAMDASNAATGEMEMPPPPPAD